LVYISKEVGTDKITDPSVIHCDNPQRCCLDCSKKYCSIYRWRTADSRMQYYKYKSYNSQQAITLYLNPMAFFTNLLSPDCLTENSKENEYVKWQNINVMVFPFFSLDWINRFYSELEQIYKEQQDEKFTFWDKIESALQKINDTSTRYYINDFYNNGRRAHDDIKEVLLSEHCYLNRFQALRKKFAILQPSTGESETDKKWKYFKGIVQELIEKLDDGSSPDNIKRGLPQALQQGGENFNFENTLDMMYKLIDQAQNHINYSRIKNKEEQARYIYRYLIKDTIIKKLIRQDKENKNV